VCESRWWRDERRCAGGAAAAAAGELKRIAALQTPHASVGQ